MKTTEVRFLLGHQHTVPLLESAGAQVPTARQALARGLDITDDAGRAETDYVFAVLMNVAPQAQVYPWRMPIGTGREFSYDDCMRRFNSDMQKAGRFGLMIHCHANATASGTGDYRGVYYDARSKLGKLAAEAAVEAVDGQFVIPTKAFECSAVKNNRPFGCINGAFELPNIAAILVETCFLDNPAHYPLARSPDGIRATARWLDGVAKAAAEALNRN